MQPAKIPILPHLTGILRAKDQLGVLTVESPLVIRVVSILRSRLGTVVLVIFLYYKHII